MPYSKYFNVSGANSTLLMRWNAIVTSRLQQHKQQPPITGIWKLRRLTSFTQPSIVEHNTWNVVPFRSEVVPVVVGSGGGNTTTNEVMKRQHVLQVLRWSSSTNSTTTSVTSSIDATITNTDDSHTYNELMHEYNSIIQNTIPKLSLKLYRTIMRSIYKQVQHGNEYDHEEFTKREEKQRRHMEYQEMNFTSSSFNNNNNNPIIPEMISLIDTLPINREDELQSRKNYYIQYTRENFVQNSDVLQDMIQPINKERERKKNFNYNHHQPMSGGTTGTNNYTTTNNNYNYNYSSYNTASTNDGPIQHNYIQYSTKKEEQYNLIQRWIHVIQQGYIHHDWLLRDMKFNTTTNNTSTGTTTTTTTTTTNTITTKLKKNRIQTHLSKVNLKKQQEINAIQLQIQQYIDKVLQYNYNIIDPNTGSNNSVEMDHLHLHRSNMAAATGVTVVTATTTLTMDLDTPSFLNTPNSSNSASNNNHNNLHTDFEWSDDEDDDE